MPKRLPLQATLAALLLVGLGSLVRADWNPRKTAQEISEGKIGKQIDTARKELRNVVRLVEGRDDGDTVKDADVVIYQHGNGEGKARGFRKGDAVQTFRDIHYKIDAISWKDWNDQATSIRILREGTTVTLYEHDNYGGRSVTFNKPGLYNLGDHGFDDLTSSITVDK